MAIKLGSNISSLQAQRRLGESSSSLAKSFERLSSGQRINRASDDAAGLAIAETLNAKRRVFSGAVRNVNDGISLFTITEGAVEQMKGILFRERELATQASNGTYSLTQRQALERERKALEDEYNRIIRTTDFNGRKVFDESEGVLTLQAGYGDSAALRANADNTLDFGALPMRVNTDSSGNQATGGSWTGLPQLTPDGRYVLFDSDATNLVSGDTNAADDIFLKDLVTGQIQRVNTDSSGNQATGGSSDNAQLTPDGRYVVFYSSATNLVSGDTNGQKDIFLKDLVTGEMRRVSTDSSGSQATGGDSLWPQLSPDGRYVLFESAATNLVSGDTNGVSDIFLKDLITGETRRVNTDSAGNQASGGISYYAQLTPDGRYVAFQSLATNLVSGDTNGERDIFLKDLVTGEMRRVNTDSSGNQATGGASGSAQLSPDGRHVLFHSAATNLVSGDTNGQIDTFLKDLVTGEMRRVSTDSSGSEVTGGASGFSQLTPDGRYVMFESSATNLVSGDTNGQSDIFLKDLITGETRRINTDSSGSQASGGASNYVRLTPDGRYAVFRSGATNLVNGDTNGLNDIFLVANPLAERYSIALQFGASLQTQSGAQYMQTYLDQQLNDLNGFQGQLGAIQQRLSVAANVLSAMNENMAAAESRIRDIDVASESAGLTRTTIAQQAASAILAQANQGPALALTLLQ